MKKYGLIVFLLGAVALAGILPTSRGGTGSNLTPAAGKIVYSTSSGMAVTAAGSQNQILISNGTSAPTFNSSLVMPAGGTVVIAAGGTTSQSQQMTIKPGSTLATPVSGALESNGTHIWWTDSSGVRHLLDNSGQP